MGTTLKKKILAIVMILALLLTQFSTTVFAVTEEIENLTTEEEIVEELEESLDEEDTENTIEAETEETTDEEQEEIVSSEETEPEETEIQEEDTSQEEQAEEQSISLSTLSVDDGIAVVASSETGDFILGIETDDTVYLGVIDGSYSLVGHNMHYAKYQGKNYMAFCVEWTVDSPESSFTVGTDVTVVRKESDYEKIAAMIFFGYTSVYGTGIPSTTAGWQAACATQQYVWEYIYNNITTEYGYPDRDSWDSSYMSSSIYADWLEETEEAYDDYYNNEVSFDGETYKVALGESTTLTDTEGSLQYYPSFSKTINGVTFKHTEGENTLTVTVSSSCTTENVTFDSEDYDIYKETTLGTEYDDDTMSEYIHFRESGYQDLIFSNYLDAQSFSVTIEAYGAYVRITKTDTGTTLLSGSKIGIYSDSSCSTLLDSATTSSKGTVTFDWLEAGTYYIKEISAPDGYLINDTIYEIELGAGDEEDLTIVDSEPTGEITVTKENTNGDTVSGATFKITAAEDITNYAGTTTYYSSGDTVATLTTGSDGTATVSDLPLGKYTITETSVPEGYLLNTTSKTVTLSYYDDETEVIYGSATIVNEEPTGELTVTKTDTDTGNSSRVISGSVFHGDATLAGAVYTLYAAEDITNVEGTITYFTEDTAIATFTFDEEGEATAKITNTSTKASLSTSNGTVKGLPLGSYYLVETTAPEGYLKDTSTYSVTLSYKDEETSVITASTTVYETVEQAKFEVIKVSTNTSEVASTVEGAEFTAILTKYVDYYGSFDEALLHLDEYAEDEYSVFTTDSSGHGVSGYLAYGEYTVSETVTPSSTIEPVDDFTVTIDEDGEVIKEFVVNNAPFESFIKIIKYDEDSGETVTYSSATFKLYKLNESTGEWEEVGCKVGKTTYYEWTTDEEGIAYTETKLEGGTYKVEEIVTPDGFLNTEDVEFEVSLDNETVYWDEDYDAYITVSVTNEQPKGELVINKSVNLNEDVDLSLVDVDFTQIEFTLTAAETIIDYTDGEVIYNAGDIVGVYNLEEDGTLDITDLWMGSYTLEETTTLDGLVVNDTVYDVTFTKEDNTTKVYTVELDIENDATLVEISKTDVDGNFVEGTILTLYDNEGNVVTEWTVTDDEYIIEGLNVNETYTLSETYTVEGYVTAKDITFTVENTKDTQEVNMTDIKVLAIKTDVDGNVLDGTELSVLDSDGNTVDSWTVGQELVSLTKDEMQALVNGATVEGEYSIIEDEEITYSISYTITGIEGANYYLLKLVNPETSEIGYYYINLDGTESYHLVRNLTEGNTYTLSETYTLDEYVTATDIDFTINDTEDDINIAMVDKQFSITKVDIAGEELEGAELTIYDEDGNIVDQWISTTETHYVTGLEEGKTYTLVETLTPEGYVTIEDYEFTITDEKVNEHLDVVDEIIESTLNIYKEATTDSSITGLTAGTLLADATFEIYDEDGNLVTTITTDEEGLASTTLEYGTYTIKEIAAPDYYLKDEDETATIEVVENGAEIELTWGNEAVELGLEITKTGINQAQPNDEIKYDFTIQNNSNVDVDNFTWTDELPYEYITITKLFTGTYNYEHDYRVYYQLVDSDEWIEIANEDTEDGTYSTLENNYIDFTDIDGTVARFKVEFGTVEPDFASNEDDQPFMYCKVNSDIQEDDEWTNYTYLTGTYTTDNGTTVELEDIDKWTTITYAYELEVENTLPLTGK